MIDVGLNIAQIWPSLNGIIYQLHFFLLKYLRNKRMGSWLVYIICIKCIPHISHHHCYIESCLQLLCVVGCVKCYLISLMK